MEIWELIIRTHVHVHAAELAIKAKNLQAAYDELKDLYDGLGSVLYLTRPDDKSDD